MLVAGVLQQQAIIELEQAWKEKLFERLRSGGTPLGHLFDAARRKIVADNPGFEGMLVKAPSLFPRMQLPEESKAKTEKKVQENKAKAEKKIQESMRVL